MPDTRTDFALVLQTLTSARDAAVPGSNGHASCEAAIAALSRIEAENTRLAGTLADQRAFEAAIRRYFRADHIEAALVSCPHPTQECSDCGPGCGR